MDHDVYLQGSYPNSTNIRGDSDVDVVVESSNTFYHNVPENRRFEYGLTTPGRYGWEDVRGHVLQALCNHYGSSVAEGDKCIKVAGKTGRLNADVVPCCTYHQYRAVRHYSTGIVFWTRSRIQIINFPKLHKSNGESNNALCHTRYKPAIRMFKNARNEAENDFPSYFLEGLLYNVPNNCFSGSMRSTYTQVLGSLMAADEAGALERFYCQNGQHKLIGDMPWQTSLFAVRQAISALARLWTTWP